MQFPSYALQVYALSYFLCSTLYIIPYKSQARRSSSELVFTYFMLSKYLCVPNTNHKYNTFMLYFIPHRKKFWNLLISIYTSHILRIRINGPRLAINFDDFMEHFLLILIKFANQLINHLTHFYFCNKALFDTLT